MNYYNENDPKAAAWLRELIRQKLIPAGHVDTRSITEVKPDDLSDYTQCHFFAGIGGWSYALELAGWPSDKPVWTGSCPCQPFSNAGKQKGESDARHLWPVFRDLIRTRKPATVFGEQVASKLGREWLAGVFADLEGMDYSRAGADLCAAGVGAPHIRQRLFWVADAGSQSARRQLLRSGEGPGSAEQRTPDQSGGSSRARGVVDSDCSEEERFRPVCVSVEPKQEAGRPVYADAWKDWDVVQCADGKARRVESGTFPLAYGFPGRVGILRGYGNAIVPQVAAVFIKSFTEAVYEKEHCT